MLFRSMRSASTRMFGQVEGCAKSNFMRLSAGTWERFLSGSRLVAKKGREVVVNAPARCLPVYPEPRMIIGCVMMEVIVGCVSAAA